MSVSCAAVRGSYDLVVLQSRAVLNLMKAVNSSARTPNTNIMKTTLTNTLAALSVALLASFTLANCTSSPRSTTGGWHNMGVGPKDNQQMPDANMPGHGQSHASSSKTKPGGWHNMGVGPKDNQPMPDANMPGKR
jgi:hypothetical protein